MKDREHWGGNVVLVVWPWLRREHCFHSVDGQWRQSWPLEQGSLPEFTPGRDKKDTAFGFCKYMHHSSWLFLSRILPDPEDLGTSVWICPQTLGHHPPQMETYSCTGRQTAQGQVWWVDDGKPCRWISCEMERGVLSTWALTVPDPSSHSADK
jgi:hypothetical protein